MGNSSGMLSRDAYDRANILEAREKCKHIHSQIMTCQSSGGAGCREKLGELKECMEANVVPLPEWNEGPRLNNVRDGDATDWAAGREFSLVETLYMTPDHKELMRQSITCRNQNTDKGTQVAGCESILNSLASMNAALRNRVAQIPAEDQKAAALNYLKARQEYARRFPSPNNADIVIPGYEVKGNQL